jgi:hypothetical protein
MRAILIITSALAVIVSASSCSTVKNFNQRKYTEGQFRDLNLFKERPTVCATDIPPVSTDSCQPKLNAAIEQIKNQNLLLTSQGLIPSCELLRTEYPGISAKMDSAIAKQVNRDSASWMNDSLPESVEAALSTQAMVGLGTLGGLITITAPQSIWFFAIPMIGVPFFLVGSIIAAAIAMAKISRGEIDKKFRGAMKLWAVCMVINLLLGSMVIMHYAFV